MMFHLWLWNLAVISCELSVAGDTAHANRETMDLLFSLPDSMPGMYDRYQSILGW